MRWLVLLLIIITACKEESKESLSITFGSCSDQDRSEQLWAEIANENADLFVLTGDNIYASPFDSAQMLEAYEKQRNNPDFIKIRKTTPVIGTWDDHDYGWNDAGKYNKNINFAKKAFLDFFEIEKDAEIRRHNGVYQSYTIDKKDIKVKVILLDTRSFRDTLVTDSLSRHRYFNNPDGDILGEEQWVWLAQELEDKDYDLTIMASSIQVIAEEHFYEKWALFPKARKRLFELIKSKKPKNLIMISGDRHIAEISQLSIDGYDKPLYDITSSGLSHTWRNADLEKNKHRIGELIIKRNYGLLEIEKTSEGIELGIKIKGQQDSIFLDHQIIF